MNSLDIIIPAYNAEHCLERTLEAVADQKVPPELAIGVIVVNNRSTDKTSELIERWGDNGVKLVNHSASQGRSATINAGVAASIADYVLVMDADCVLVGQDCFCLLALAMSQNVDAGFGYATGSGDEFWGRYHRSLAEHRVKAGWQGWTTQCCLIKRAIFATVGGFPTDYQHYGFEDRDFVCRLKSCSESKQLKSLPELRANHDDDTSAQDVFEKMHISGRYSSGIFKRNFPNEYLATVYASVDVETASKHLVLVLRLLQPMQPIFVRIASYLSCRRSTPLMIGRPFIKLCSALSYFKGTVDRVRLDAS